MHIAQAVTGLKEYFLAFLASSRNKEWDCRGCQEETVILSYVLPHLCKTPSIQRFYCKFTERENFNIVEIVNIAVSGKFILRLFLYLLHSHMFLTFKSFFLENRFHLGNFCIIEMIL